jgi:hypothetical protein
MIATAATAARNASKLMNAASAAMSPDERPLSAREPAPWAGRG